MKKTIKNLVIICIMCFALAVIMSACQEIVKKGGLEKSKYKSYVYDTRLNEVGITRDVTDFWDVTTKYKGLKPKQISFEGKEYNLEYKCTTGIALTPYEEDEYRDEEGNSFCFNADTGELTGCFFVYWGADKQDYTYEPITIESAQTMAEDFASKYIKVEGYVVKSSTSYYPEAISENYALYDFSFRKYVGDVRLTDGFSVTIGNDGRLVSFSSLTAGLFSGDEKLDFDYEEVEQSIKEKMKSLLGDKNEYGYTIGDNKVLAYTPKGELILLSEISLSQPPSQKAQALLLVLATVID